VQINLFIIQRKILVYFIIKPPISFKHQWN